MRMTKHRNRENRTKAPKSSDMLIIKLKLTRDSFEELKKLENGKNLSRDEIFCTGLRYCIGR